ncbi:MAG: diguanylate cyclase [Mariprofundales bacterium]|nr:diguanylate cyclase [Mariprofundales bacterium]
MTTQSDRGNRLGMRIMVALLILLSLLFTTLFLTIHTWQRSAIEQHARAQTEAIANTMVASLKTLMLSGDAESVHDWLKRMRAHRELQAVNILRRSGEIAFRDLQTVNRVNQLLGGTIFSRPPLPKLTAPKISSTDIARAAQGEQVVLHNYAPDQIALLKPITLESTCLQCHGYEDNTVRGILLVTTPTTAEKEAMWQTDRRLLLLLITGLLLVALLIVLMHRYMESIITALGGMLFVTDSTGTIRMVNQQAAHKLDYSKPSLIGREMSTLLTPTSQSIDLTQPHDNEEAELQSASGKAVPVSLFSAKMPVGSWIEQADMVHVLRDLSQQKRAEQEIRLAATVMETVPSAIMVADHNAKIKLINAAFTTITGYSSNEVLGKNPNILKSGRQSQEFYAKMWAQINQTGVWRGEIWNRRKNGDIYPEWLIINTMRDDTGRVSYYVSSFLDISAQKKVEDQLRHRAHHDALTELPNRVLLADRITSSLSHAKRYSYKVGILFIDIDGFKPINDTYGHDAGDELLQQIATRLLQCIRDSDTVARVGGDEFVLLLESKSQQDLLNVADKVLKAIRQPFILQATSCQVGASIGISIYPEDGDQHDLLLKQADSAMYHAKKSGKNRIALFNPKQSAGESR